MSITHGLELQERVQIMKEDSAKLIKIDNAGSRDVPLSKWMCSPYYQ